MGLAGACGCVEYRYCGIPRADCRRCDGTGRLVGGDVDGRDPVVVLRAAIMALDNGIDRKVLLEKGLLAQRPTHRHTGELPSGGQAARYGRKARDLLIEMKLLPGRPPRKVLTKAEREARKKAKAAEEERNRLFAEQSRKRLEQNLREARERKVRRAAAEAVALAHPDQFQQEVEVQEVFVALEEGIPDPSFVTHHAARRVSP